jgi:putative ABC transport system permease protein
MALGVDCLADVRLALRMLAKHPRSAIFTTVTLAVAIAATTVIFSFVNALVLKPLPIAEPGRVVLIFAMNERQGVMRGPTSLPDFLDWRASATSFDELAASDAVTTSSLETSSGPVPARVRRVTANIGRTWGLKAALGRLMWSNDDLPGRAPVVVLGHGFWTRQFGADPSCIGRTIRLDGRAHTIVGVMTPEIEIGDLALTDLWTPLPTDSAGWSRSQRTLQVTALLRTGVSAQQADAELHTISRRLADTYPDSDAGWGVRVLPFAKAMAIPETWLVLALASFAVVLVLLVACANVASLMLARVIDRRRETAVRLALGASQGQIIRPMLAESALLGLVGAAAGLLLAYAGLDVVRAVTFHPFFRQQVEFDHRVLGFVLALAIATPVLFGLGPALSASRLSIHVALQTGGTGLASSPGTQRMRAMLVVSQIAVALALSVVCVLTVRAAVTLRQADLGFETDRLLIMRMDLPESRYTTPAQVVNFQEEAVEKLARIPGVGYAAATSRLPVLDPQRIAAMTIEGIADERDRAWAVHAAVSPDYFATMGIKLIAGRTFSPRDSAEAPGVAVLSNEAAQRYWGGRDRALGGRILFDGPSASPPWLEVVGIVTDVRSSVQEKPPRPDVYLPLAQHPERRLALVLRAIKNPTDFPTAARETVGTIDSGLAIYELRTLEQALDESLANDRLAAGFFMAFALVALLLATIGLYGLMEYAVVRRTGELAVRMVLGARPVDILWMVVLQGVRLTLAGIGTGILTAYPMAKVLRSAVRGVQSTGLSLYVGLGILLVVIAILASYFPARRVMRMDLARAVQSG